MSVGCGYASVIASRASASLPPPQAVLGDDAFGLWAGLADSGDVRRAVRDTLTPPWGHSPWGYSPWVHSSWVHSSCIDSTVDGFVVGLRLPSLRISLAENLVVLEKLLRDLRRGLVVNVH